MTNDIIKVSSGYEFYANGGFVSINENLEIAQGWDGGFPVAQFEEYYDPEYPGPSKQDMIELAIKMQTLWGEFIKKLEAIK